MKSVLSTSLGQGRFSSVLAQKVTRLEWNINDTKNVWI